MGLALAKGIKSDYVASNQFVTAPLINVVWENAPTYWPDKAHLLMKYISRLLKVFISCEKPWIGLFLEQVLECFVIRTREWLWLYALPDTTNHPDGIQTHDQLTMIRKLYTLSS